VIHRASTASIAAAASRCIVGVTCEYLSSVIAIVEVTKHLGHDLRVNAAAQ
jgi:hypothetical protein